MDKIEKILIFAILAILFSFGIVLGIKLVGWSLFTVHVDETFIVTLMESGSVGYQWQVTGISDPSVLKLVKTDYIIPELTEGEGSPGEYRPGKVILTFKALEAGNAAVVLQYTRPWENNMASVAETYIVSVIVSP